MGFGVSYYPSFYPTKYPVPPTADRTGEMKKDLRLMHESGFHFLRAAALSDISLGKDGNVEISSPFIDDMAREAEKNDLGISIRLQGYVMNIRGNKDYLMSNNAVSYTHLDVYKRQLTGFNIIFLNYALVPQSVSNSGGYTFHIAPPFDDVIIAQY